MKIPILIKKNTNDLPFRTKKIDWSRLFNKKELNLILFKSEFYFLSSADTVVDEDKDSSAPAHVITVGVVGGVVAVAIVCVAVIIVLRKRRHTITLTESRGTHEFATPIVWVSATGMPPNMALFLTEIMKSLFSLIAFGL